MASPFDEVDFQAVAQVIKRRMDEARKAEHQALDTYARVIKELEGLEVFKGGNPAMREAWLDLVLQIKARKRMVADSITNTRGRIMEAQRVLMKAPNRRRPPDAEPLRLVGKSAGEGEEARHG
ncbi:hypothetical protein JCM15519_04740 [Fundidesulfovibrio butyratiphilus]